jgi:DNA-binding MarR family transcriptional regulator
LVCQRLARVYASTRQAVLFLWVVFMIGINQSELKKAQLLLTFSRGVKSRRSILETLMVRPKNCNQIAEEVELDWWSVQKHLQRLVSEKLVESFNIGQIKFYSVTNKGEEALRCCSQK